MTIYSFPSHTYLSSLTENDIICPTHSESLSYELTEAAPTSTKTGDKSKWSLTGLNFARAEPRDPERSARKPYLHRHLHSKKTVSTILIRSPSNPHRSGFLRTQSVSRTLHISSFEGCILLSALSRGNQGVTRRLSAKLADLVLVAW